MLKKTIGVAFVAVAGLMMMGGPANAGTYSDHPSIHWVNNNQLIPIQLCNSNIAVLGLTVPIDSPNSTGACINGPVQKG